MLETWQVLERRAKLAAASIHFLRRDLRQHGVIAPLAPTVELVPRAIGQLIEALGAFPTLVGYLNGRRPAGSSLVVGSEAEVQDLLYVSLKCIFPELVYEEPTRKGAAGYSVGDFCIPSLNLILETKFVASRTDVKTKADEVAEDIWKYTNQTDCENIVFFIYDPQILIPDRVNYARSLSASSDEFKSRGREVQVITVIKP